MRLDRFIAETTGLSRALSQKTIRQKRVSVDDEIINRPAQAISVDSIIRLDGIELSPPRKHYIMLYKPAGCVCSTDDPTHPSALDLIALDSLKGMHFAGRLDLEATGLVLITNDGAWSHRITSPKRHVPKTYLAELAVALEDKAVKQLLGGVQLNNEKGVSKATRVERIDRTHARITITEGKYHQVKRMFGAVGNRVLALHRESIGDLRLDPDLGPGEYRELATEETGLFD